MRHSKAVLLIVVAAVLGMVLGVVLTRAQHDAGIAQARADAQVVLDAVRDSMRTIMAQQVDTVTVPGEHVTLYRMRLDTVYDTLYAPTADSSMARAIVDTLWHTVYDTVWSGGTTLRYRQSETTAAYTIDIECNANLLQPRNSFARYTLDLNRDAVCQPQPTLWVGGGIFAGRPYGMLGARLRHNLLISAQAGFEDGSGGASIGTTFGVAAQYGFKLGVLGL